MLTYCPVNQAMQTPVQDVQDAVAVVGASACNVYIDCHVAIGMLNPLNTLNSDGAG